MFNILVICAIFVIPSSLANQANLDKAAKDCIKELGVKTDNNVPDKEDGEKKCLAKCMGLKSGIMDDKGSLVEWRVPEHLKTKMKECFEKSTETDICKKANQVVKCLE